MLSLMKHLSPAHLDTGTFVVLFSKSLCMGYFVIFDLLFCTAYHIVHLLCAGMCCTAV